MASAALFIGWGQGVRGRERQAVQVFNEAMQYDTRLKEQGEIESFEPVALEPHGGDLAGFLLVKGERAKLERLRFSPEVLRLNVRAGQVVDKFGVVSAFVGEELDSQFAMFQQAAGELGGK